MPPSPPNSIRDFLTSTSAADSSTRFLRGATASASLAGVLHGTCLSEGLAELSGQSILLAAKDQLVAGLAVIELDGVARRIIICPPDVRSEQLPSVIAKGGIDAIVSDYELDDRACPRNLKRISCGSAPTPIAQPVKTECCATEWVLLTSGTSGEPKMIVHSFASLMAPIGMSQDHMTSPSVVWGTFYDIRRYGGLQIFLRAVLGSGSLVLSSMGEPVADHLARLGTYGVTHLSGTPSQWRRVLMSPQARAISPQYIRLSGEIADQSILNALHSFYPNSAIGHAFASTEAGVAFEVNDGLAGFPAALLGRRGDVEMRIVNDSLRIRSTRAASRYMDEKHGDLEDEEGFVDTGDVVELRGGRYHFLGRRNGVINVGGLKVYPEEVEAVINRHPAVRMSVVRSRSNPFMGSLVSADIVLKEGVPKEDAKLKSEILEICRQALPAHKIPATIRYAPSLEVAAAGKLVRRHSQAT